MRKSYRILLVSLLVMSVTLSCNLIQYLPENGTITNQTNPGGEALQPGQEEEVNSLDLSQARLYLTDLPNGFAEMTPDQINAIGVTEDRLGAGISGLLSQAQTQNFTAFINQDLFSYEIVYSVILAPLNGLEKTAVDLYFSNPNQVAQDFSTQSGIVTTTKALVNSIGNSAIGLTSISTSNGFEIVTDTIISRRGAAVQVLITIYANGTTPPASAEALAQIIDSRLETAQ